jgi:uncharacterized membrane protein YdbT with pleckstrin-like domain
VVISQKALNPGESIVVSTRTHPKALLLPLLTLVALLAAGVLFQVFVSDDSTALLVLWAVIGVLVLWRVVWPFLDWLTSSYTITDRRLLTRTGVITRRGHDIPLSRISDVSFERDLVDRVLGCGTLVITNASTNGQVLVYDIPRVEDAQSRLNELLHRLHGGETRTVEGN